MDLICRTAKVIRCGWGVAMGMALMLPGPCAAAEPVPAAEVPADADLVAPDDALVVDPVRSAAMAAVAGRRAPLVFRVVSGAADDVVADFERGFSETRLRFVSELKDAFDREVLETREIDSLKFRELQRTFLAAGEGYPVDLALAQVWAKGYEGEGWRRRLGAVLKSVMTECLITELNGDVVPIVADVGETETVASWSAVEPRVREVDPAQVLSIGEAGRELRRRLESRDRSAWAYLAGVLRSNLVEDRFLTALVLRERFGDQVEGRAYSRGEVIVRAGEPVDRWAALAIEYFRRTGHPAETEVAAAPDVVSSEPALPVTPAPNSPRPSSVFLYMAVGVGCVVGLVGAHRWRRRRAKKAGALVVATAGGEPVIEAGRRSPMQRALLPHLAREMKDRLVGALFSQRQELLANEAKASQRVAELEERLAKIQPALAAKIRSYEQRIQALERELAQKDQDTQDLIRAKIVLARKELDAEVQRSRVRWN